MKDEKESTGKGERPDKVEIQMTPMIDIVFQLLVFFIMTFKIVAQEGDFTIRMPLGTRQGEDPSPITPPVVLRMTARPDGSLNKIYWTNRPIRDFEHLRAHTVARLGSERGPGSVANQLEIELNCDDNLRYENVIKAITAVSGRPLTDSPTGRRMGIERLVGKIRFSQPKRTENP